MRVLVEATALETSHRYRGIGRYVEGLLWGMRANGGGVDRLGIEQGERRVTRWRRQADFWFWAESWARLPEELARALGDYDVYHSTEPYSLAPHPRHESARTARCLRLATCHDLIPLLFPQLYRQITDKLYFAWLRRAVRRLDGMIAISQTVKDSLINLLGVRADRVAVVPHGVEPRFFAPPPASTPHPLQSTGAEESASNRHLPPETPYFFYSGGHDGRKRVGLILDAFARVQQQLPERLVLAGQPDGGTRLVCAKADALRLGARVVLLPYVSDDQLRVLYRGATAFVFPSLYEGFGLPILEAQAAQCPVITSRRAALPEVAGAAALYLDPADEAEECAALADHLRVLSQDAALRARLIAAGTANARRYTWQQTAQLTLAAYRRAMAGEAQS